MIDKSRLRHPWEHAVFAVTVLLNLAMMAGAVLLAINGREWLKAYPELKPFAGGLRATAIAALLSPPALIVLRNTRRAIVRGNAVLLSRDQLPELYTTFQRFCEAVGLHPAPELYLTEEAIHDYSGAYSTWWRDYVVLRAWFLESDLARSREVYEFFLAREVGRVHLHHTKWWDEMLICYVLSIPGLRNPIEHVRTFSHDRYALALAPDSLRGLIVQSSGRRMLRHVSVPAYVRQAITFGNQWARIAARTRHFPHVSMRVRLLYEAGFITIDGTPPVAPTLPAATERKQLAER